MAPSLLGYELRAGRMEPVARVASGGIASAALGAELRPVGQYLRVIDPATGEPIPVADEVKRDYRVAEERLTREIQAHAVAEQARIAAEAQAAREAQARLSAEERAAQAEAALQAALPELAQRRAGETGP